MKQILTQLTTVANFALVSAVALACSSSAGDANGQSDAAAATNGIAERNPAVCGSAPITGDGIGWLRPGMPIDTILANCTVTADTTVLILGEASPRIISVALGADTIMLEGSNGYIWRILVRSPGLMTYDSVHVGSPIGALLQYPDLTPLTGSGYLYAVSESRHCGLTFRLSEPPSTGKDWTNTDLRELSPEVYVTRIIVHGCQSTPDWGLP